MGYDAKISEEECKRLSQVLEAKAMPVHCRVYETAKLPKRAGTNIKTAHTAAAAETARRTFKRP